MRYAGFIFAVRPFNQRLSELTPMPRRLHSLFCVNFSWMILALTRYCKDSADTTDCFEVLFVSATTWLLLCISLGTTAGKSLVATMLLVVDPRATGVPATGRRIASLSWVVAMFSKRGGWMRMRGWLIIVVPFNRSFRDFAGKSSDGPRKKRYLKKIGLWEFWYIFNYILIDPHPLMKILFPKFKKTFVAYPLYVHSNCACELQHKHWINVV